jgi:hypothetical protein
VLSALSVAKNQVILRSINQGHASLTAVRTSKTPVPAASQKTDVAWSLIVFGILLLLVFLGQ